MSDIRKQLIKKLFSAISDNDIILVEHLINAKIDGENLTNLKFNDISPFQYACSLGNEDVVKMFLDRKLYDSNYALEYAIIGGNNNIIKMLFDYDVNADNIIKNEDMATIHKLMINRLTQTDELCSICLDDNSKMPMMKTKCGHFFHINCIEDWISNKKQNLCPNCRGKISFGKRQVKRQIKRLSRKRKTLRTSKLRKLSKLSKLSRKKIK